MGISSDGILCFGHDLGEDLEGLVPWCPEGTEDDEDEDEKEDDFDAWLVEVSGGSGKDEAWQRYEIWADENMPGASYQESMPAWEAAEPDGRDALDAAYERERELTASCPIEIITHCSYDYPMRIVAVRGTEIRAYRGSPKEIDWSALQALVDERLPAAVEFCKEHGIPFEDPTWILTSVYG